MFPKIDLKTTEKDAKMKHWFIASPIGKKKIETNKQSTFNRNIIISFFYLKIFSLEKFKNWCFLYITNFSLFLIILVNKLNFLGMNYYNRIFLSNHILIKAILPMWMIEFLNAYINNYKNQSLRIINTIFTDPHYN